MADRRHPVVVVLGATVVSVVESRSTVRRTLNHCCVTISFVIDCPVDGIAKIKAYLDQQMAAGALRYGMNVSETALMTCLVTAPAGGLHVHFVDGGDGGYTSAAKTMKAIAAAAAPGGG